MKFEWKLEARYKAGKADGCAEMQEELDAKRAVWKQPFFTPTYIL